VVEEFDLVLWRPFVSIDAIEHHAQAALFNEERHLAQHKALVPLDVA